MIRYLHDRVTLEDHSYICDPYSINGSMAILRIGKYTSIAANLCVDLGFQHYYKAATTFPMHILKEGVPSNVWAKGDIILKSDVWCGNNVTLMSGITIENGAIVGANSTVRRDLLPYEIYTGSKTPEKFRFKPEIIEKLLEISWWDWPEERIILNAELLVDRDINKFINEHK